MGNPTPPFNNNLKGPIGLPGKPGPAGIKGDKGDRGVVGPKGDKGDRGDKGDPGRSGTQGVKGEDGASGGLQDPGGNGIVVRTSLNTTLFRTIQAGDATVVVTNGNGVAGDPTIVGNYQAGSGITITGNIITSLAGGGTVTSVAGAGPIVITGTPTINPTVTIQGSIVSGAVITTAQNLGLLTTGLLKGTVSGGINTISTAISGTDYQPPGAYITALTSDVTATGPGSAVATIGINKVTYAKFQQASAFTLIGNPTNATANVSEITLGAGLSFSGSTLNSTNLRADGIAVGTIQLASIAAATLPVDTTVWVDTVGDCFILRLSALTTTATTVVTASGKAGYQWLRLASINIKNAVVTDWYLDPVSGNDENDGLTSITALKTCGEWALRTRGLSDINTIVHVLNDIPDSDTITILCDGVSVTFQGTQTVVQTQTVASAQARTPVSNLSNQITVTGFNFSPYLNTLLRVQGTTNYAPITKIVGTGVVRLGELWDTTSFVQASASGVTAAQTIEIVKTTKGPSNVIHSGNIFLELQDITIDGAGTTSITCTGNNASVFMNRVIIGGTSFKYTSPSISNTGECILFKSSLSVILNTAFLAQGFTSTSPSISCQGSGGHEFIKIRSAVLQGCIMNAAPAGIEFNGDLGQFDLSPGQAGIALNRFGVGSTLLFTSGSHYGNGNDATANIWLIQDNNICTYLSSSPPTMNAGLGVNIDNHNISLSALPYPINPYSGSGAVTQTTVAGIEVLDTSGNTFGRTIVAGDSTIAITNGNGVAGNPSIVGNYVGGTGITVTGNSIASTGGTVRADGINIGTIQLATLAAAPLADGTIAYVDSVGDCFKLVQDTLTTDAITVIAASGKAGYQWHRLGILNQNFFSVTNWYVDPVSGNDENTGLVGHALKTYQELSRRLFGRNTTTAVIVNALSDATDADILSVNFAPLFSTSLTVLGIETVANSGTVASHIVPNYIGGNTLNQITITGFNWSTHVGKLVRKSGASGGTGVYASVLADLGSGTALIAPTALNGLPNSGSYFQTGDVVEVLNLTKAPRIQTGNTGTLTVNFCSLYRSSATWTATMNGGNTILSLSFDTIGVGTTFSNSVQAKAFVASVLSVNNSFSSAQNVNLTNVAFLGTSPFISLGSLGGATITLNDIILYPTSVSAGTQVMSLGPTATVTLSSRTSPGIGIGIFNLQSSAVGIVLSNNSVLTSSYIYGANNNSSSWILAYPRGTRNISAAELSSVFFESSSAGTKIDWTNNASSNNGSSAPNSLIGYGSNVLDRYANGRGSSIASTSSLFPTGIITYREWTVTGTTTINTITIFPEVNGVSILNDGLIIELDIQDGLTITNNAAHTNFVDAQILLAGGVNAVLPAGSHITLKFNKVYRTGTGTWVEVSRDTGPAVSIWGNPTSAIALQQNIVSTGANLFLGSNGSNTAIAFSTIPASAITGLPAAGITALTGDVTATGPGSAVATIGINKVTYAKFQQASAHTLIGNPTGSTANVSEITLGSGLSFSGSTLTATGTGGTVTAVTASSPLFSSGGITPNITIQGAIVSGSTSTTAQNLGALTTGIILGTVSGGINTLSTLGIGSGLSLVSGTLSATGSGGTVTTVTGTAPIVITSTPTTTPNVTIQGSIVSGSTSTTAQNIGSLTTGILFGTVSGGINTISTLTIGSGLTLTGSTLSAIAGGVGTVTTVTGTAPIVITSTPTTTPNVTIQGSIVSGSASTTAQNLGSLTTGILLGTVSGGINTISTLIIGGGLTLTGSTLSAATGGGGTVTTVTGTAPIFITSTPTTTPNVTIQGSFVSGSTSTAAQNLGSLNNGTLQQTISAGVATVSAFNGATGSIPFYSVNGQLDQNNGNLFWDNGIEQLNVNSAQVTNTLSLLGSTAIAFTTGIQNITKTSGTLAFSTTGAGGFTFSPNSTPTMELTTAGAVRIDSLSAGGLVKAFATTGQLGIATAGTDYVSSVAVTAPITNTGTSTSPNIGHATSGVAAGLWLFGSSAFVQVDSRGHVTSINPDPNLLSGPFTGDATTPSAGSTVTKVIAIHETGGPTQLTFGAIPDSNPNATALVRVGGTSTIIGVATTALYVRNRRDYFVSIPSLQAVNANPAGQQIATSSPTPFSSGVTTNPIEYPNTDFIATKIELELNLIASIGVASTVNVWATRNGSLISGTMFTFTPGTTGLGTMILGPVSTGSASASDTYGIQMVYNGNFITGPFGAQLAYSLRMSLST